ncbi:probable mitochondrial glutathione transporter SLC25A40 [Haliotis rufescens]|uniref:probable mitochondrial glutathione transporter SLC25A40 n=1 Tax=Haliotis rufescens TaxID=6454 RepID=UPI00201F47BE|nr:probable mitochondrial glutathione transporter SLC25A40 [Haliotis rufescens]
MTMAIEKSRRHGVFITPFQQMVASCSGAMLTSISMTPFDVVKIRLQAQRKPFVKGDCFLYCNGLMDHICACLNGQPATSSQWYKQPGAFNSTKDAFIHIVRNEGITSLWSGLPPTLVMAVPATVIYFTCYEQLKVAFKYQDSKPSDWWIPMFSGALARVWAVSLISPLELIRTKMQAEQLTYSQITKSMRRAVQADGVLSLWRGLGPTLLRDVPFSALYWFSYENLKSYVLLTRGSTDLRFSESFLTGATAGTIAAVLTLPFDVIKTHRQLEFGEMMTHTGSHRKRQVSSTWLLIVRLYRQQGINSLFTGIVPRISKVAPACAIMISSYEYFKLFFRNRNDETVKSLSRN